MIPDVRVDAPVVALDRTNIVDLALAADPSNHEAPRQESNQTI